MQKLSENIETIISVLVKHKIDYIVVGGVGNILHGANISTKDLDVCPKNTIENLSRLSVALIELNAKLRGAEDVPVPIVPELLLNMQIGTWITTYGELDVLHSIPSGPHGKQQSYEQLLKNSRFGTTGTLIVRIAALKDIVASKRFAGRPKDLEVLPELEELLREQENDDSEK